MINLSKLEEVTDLRTAWEHEASDFTPWLAQEENISLLADTLGLEITVEERESDVGDFHVDILAVETGTNRKIIIENQLEDTNHTDEDIGFFLCEIKLYRIGDSAPAAA